MKKEQGVTLTSLIIYITIMLIAISIIATITVYFYNNVGEIGKNVDPMQEYIKFNSFFTEDANKQGNKVLEYSRGENSLENYIVFSDGTQYTFKKQNGDDLGNVYKGNAKICEELYDLYFEYKIDEETKKEVIEVKYKITSDDSERTAKFILVS